MIDRDAFLNWAEVQFGDYRGDGDEIKFNSPFDPDGDDHKRKLWCNVAGGKDKREDGVYHCWISGEKGTLVGLVMRIEKCDRDRALDILGGDRSIAAIESQLADIFRTKETLPAPKPAPVGLQMPEGVVPLATLNAYDRRRSAAESYLWGRKIPPKGFFVGISGTYKDRIVIPYYDRSGDLIYYNGRHLWKDSPKYLGPPKELGIGKGDVVYMPAWPEHGQTIHVTEGEFDAFSLHLCGLNAASVGGSNMTWNQIKILRDYKVVAAVDNDDAGMAAMVRIIGGLRENGITNVSYVRPPKGLKDWNEFLVRYKPITVSKYIAEHSKPSDGVLF